MKIFFDLFACLYCRFDYIACIGVWKTTKRTIGNDMITTVKLISTTTSVTCIARVVRQTKCFAHVQREGKTFTEKLSLRTGRICDDEFTFVSSGDLETLTKQNKTPGNRVNNKRQ